MSAPQSITPYPIGIPGTPWGAAERSAWLAASDPAQLRRGGGRAAQARLPAQAELFQYGALDYAHLGLGRYPLFAVRSRAWNPISRWW